MPTPTFMCWSSDNRECLDARAPSRTSATSETKIILATASVYPRTSVYTFTFLLLSWPELRGMRKEGGGRWQSHQSHAYGNNPKAGKSGWWRMHGSAAEGGDGCDCACELGDSKCGRWEPAPAQGHVRCRRPSSSGIGDEALRKGKNVFKSVNRTDQRAGTVAAYTFPRKERQVIWQHN